MKEKKNREKAAEYKYFFTNYLAMRTNLSIGSPSSWLMCRTVFKFLKKIVREDKVEYEANTFHWR